MSVLDIAIVDVIHVIIPFLIYLFYAAYKKFDDQRENELAIIITNFSSLYISIKYNTELIEGFPLILINLPLVISYYKKNHISIIVASVVIVAYSFYFYQAFLWLLIIEYLIYYFVYFVFYKKFKLNTFILLFITIKTLFIFIVLNLKNSNFDMYLKAMILGVIFVLATRLIIYLFDKAEDILRLHMLSKEIERDKQIRTTLFKITHEIKNPIAVCKGYLDMFDVDNKNHAKKYVPIMKEEIDKTLLLLEDFLSFGNVKLNIDVLDINYLLEDLVNSFKLYWKENKIKYDIDILDEEIFINGDYNRLMQVFLNIIKNSMEAFNQNPKISISSKIKKDKIYIYFKDNGNGINKDIIDKIKEPFFTTKDKGTGLGIPLSIEIIKGHKGQIKYDSKEGEYTLVTIILPIITF